MIIWFPLYRLLLSDASLEHLTESKLQHDHRKRIPGIIDL
jgi:hypothetical protein